MSMSRKWIIAAVALLAAGVLLGGVALALLGFDFKKLNTVTYVTNTYEVKEDFQNVTIDADTEDIALVFSDGKGCRVVCREEADKPHQVGVRGDSLMIGRQDKPSLQFVVIAENPAITVYLPKAAYKALSIDADTGDVDIPGDFAFDSIRVALDTGDVVCRASAAGDISIRSDTGHITVSGLTATGMNLSSDTGRVEVSDVDLTGGMEIGENTGKVVMNHVSCAAFTSRGRTGDLTMTGVIMTGEMHLERDTGDITWEGCDAGTIRVKTDTGDVTGTILSDKMFIVQTDTGRVEVPKTITGGRCEITTDTGDIRLEIAK